MQVTGYIILCSLSRVACHVLHINAHVMCYISHMVYMTCIGELLVNFHVSEMWQLHGYTVGVK
jgi:hypothetical protein